MNMISTGTFLSEMDASSKPETLVSKLVSAWEKKNAKLARAGGVSLMALSLAACGSSSDDSTTTVEDTTTVTPTPTTPVVDAAKTINLTTVTDAAAGGSGDDNINGIVQAAGDTGTTAFPGDSVDGGAGTDTFTITHAGAVGGTADYTISALAVSNTEKVLVSNFETSTNDTIVDTSLMSGVTTLGIASSSSTGDTVFSNVASLVDAEVRNSAGDVTITYLAAPIAGTADVQALTLSNNTAGDITINGVETLNVVSELATSTVNDIIGNGLATVNISGSAKLTVSSSIGFAATVNGTAVDGTLDASATTGGVVLTTTSAQTIAATLGSGDDSLDFGATLTANDTADGGAGSDTLKMNEAAITTQLTNVSNFETISFNANAASAAAVTFDLSKINADMSTVVFDADDHGAGTKDHIVSNHTDQTIKITNTTADASSGNTDVTINNKSDSGSDVLNITIEEANDAETTDIDSLTAANYETVNLTSTKKATTTTAVENQIDTLAIASAKSAVITGNTDLQIDAITGGAMTSFDASGLNGKLAATFSSGDKITATAAQKATTFAFGTTLDKNDTVIGGAGKDTVTATLSGSITDDTGKLNISGIETVTLTTGSNNTLDFSNITGASTIAVSANTQTITGFDLGATLQTTGAATVKLTAADATGADDTLKIQQKLDGNVDNVIEGKNIENVTIEVYDTGATANVAGFDLDSLEVSTVTFTQNALSSADADVDLAATILHKNVSTVTSSAMKGAQTFSAANATNAVTFNLAGSGIATITGSGKADTFNIASTGNIIHAITGGAGTDVANITVTTGFVDPSDIAVETMNMTVAPGVDITIGNNQPFNAATTSISLLGGNSVSTFDADGTGTTIAATVTSYDASGFGGNVLLLVANDSLDSTLALKAGALATDQVTTTYTASATDKPNMTGVETLVANVSDSATSAVTAVIDTSGSTGLKTVSLNLANADSATVSGLTGSETIQVTDATSTNGANTVTATLADATGAADSIKFKLKGSSAGKIDDGLLLTTNDIETVDIYADSAESVSLANLAMTAAGSTMSLTVTGDSALTISALNADVTSIDASGMLTGGSVVMTGRSATAASTYTGYTGNDTFIMMNTGDALDAGTGTGDTLDINATGALGAIAVDLSSTTDQISSMNGLGNTTVQKGFDNVDLAGYTLNGSSITGHATANTITGSAQVDVINPGLGADTVTAGNGNDVITITEATSSVDTLKFTGTANSAATNGSDDITGFVNGTDILDLDAIANGVTKVYEEIAADTGANITTAANVIVSLDEGNDTITQLATTIAADATVTATNGFIVFGDGTDALLYHSTDLAGNGTETLIATIRGIADVSDFVTADFVFA